MKGAVLVSSTPMRTTRTSLDGVPPALLPLGRIIEVDCTSATAAGAGFGAQHGAIRAGCDVGVLGEPPREGPPIQRENTMLRGLAIKSSDDMRPLGGANVLLGQPEVAVKRARKIQSANIWLAPFPKFRASRCCWRSIILYLNEFIAFHLGAGLERLERDPLQHRGSVTVAGPRPRPDERPKLDADAAYFFKKYKIYATVTGQRNVVPRRRAAAAAAVAANTDRLQS